MLSLTIASTRPCTSSSAACGEPLDRLHLAPASRATWAQLLVSRLGGGLALQVGEGRDVVVSAAVTITPWSRCTAREQVARLRSGLIVTGWRSRRSARRRAPGRSSRTGPARTRSSQPASSATALHHLDVVAGELAGARVDEGERRVGALGPTRTTRCPSPSAVLAAWPDSRPVRQAAPTARGRVRRASVCRACGRFLTPPAHYRLVIAQDPVPGSSRLQPWRTGWRMIVLSFSGAVREGSFR